MADQPKAAPPHGMEAYDLGGADDLGALSKEQQEKLNKHKIKTRIDNERYLRQHPEVDCMLATFLREVFLQRPDDIREFAADYFNSPDLPDIVEKALNQQEEQFRQMKVFKNTHCQESSVLPGQL